MSQFFSRELEAHEIFWFYLVAVGVFVFPIIKVDYLFFDDNFRTLLLDDHLWRDSGRILVQLFYNGISFSAATPNVFPLAHLIALPVVAVSLQALAMHYFVPCRWVDCLVVLPLFYSPTTLGILIYQYDGPAVMLGLAAVIHAIVYGAERRGSRLLVPAVLIALSLSLYQVLLNVLLGLYCVEVAIHIARGASLESVSRLLAKRAGQLAAGLLLYYLTALQFLNTWRSPLLPFDEGWRRVIWARFSQAGESVLLFINAGNRWLFTALAVCGLLGYLWGALSVFKRCDSAMRTATLLVLYVMVIPLMGILVAGVLPFFIYYGPSARVLLGLAPILVGLSFFSHRFLAALNAKAPWLLTIPVFCMLSFSFMYGRVLSAQKELESSILYSLAYDIHSRPELRNAEIMYLVDSETSPVRRPASLAVAKEIPALNYLGGGWQREGEGYLVMPDQFPFVGITNVRWLAPAAFEAVVGKQQWVSNGLYDIYLSGGNGYIQMKKIDSTLRQERH